MSHTHTLFGEVRTAIGKSAVVHRVAMKAGKALRRLRRQGTELHNATRGRS